MIRSAQIRITDTGMELVIPSRKRTTEILYSTVATITFLPFACLLISNLAVFSDWQSLMLFLGVLVVLIAGGLLIGVLPLMWELDGQEVVQINRQYLVIRRQACNLARQTNYRAELIENLHVEQNSFNQLHPVKPESIIFGQHYGRIAFAYDAKNYRLGGAFERFGSGLSPDEAQHIIGEIRQRFPEYAK